MDGNAQANTRVDFGRSLVKVPETQFLPHTEKEILLRYSALDGNGYNFCLS